MRKTINFFLISIPVVPVQMQIQFSNGKNPMIKLRIGNYNSAVLMNSLESQVLRIK